MRKFPWGKNLKQNAGGVPKTTRGIDKIMCSCHEAEQKEERNKGDFLGPEVRTK